MKVAFTTSDRIHINAHFGWSKEIDMYEVSKDGYEFLETLKFDNNLKQDGNDDKLSPKLDALVDCKIVYVMAIGDTAAAKLIKKGITPVLANSEEDAIADVLDKLVQTLNGSPPPWLRKALQENSQSFEDELEEEAAV
ncbi:nitrogen fixation protein NifX [Scytonema sp. NUACC26]|uniref:nitrogen fixation protein NifX n=1 Tax=Scytonema sp. NUACC26 TaxID=3140176 RepID=UPI0034DC8F5B